MVCIGALPLVEWDEPVIAISSAVSSIPSSGLRARHHDLHRKQECSHEILLSEAKLACIGCDVLWDFAVLSITVSLLHTLLYTGLSGPHSHIWEKQSRPHSYSPPAGLRHQPSHHPVPEASLDESAQGSLRPPLTYLLGDPEKQTCPAFLHGCQRNTFLPPRFLTELPSPLCCSLIYYFN